MSVKSSLLKTLELNKGCFISGQELARMLDVSRTSVWKAAKSLQDEGYLIEAVTNKGYMLAEESRILSEEAISGFLDPGIGSVSITIMDNTDSTNNEAKRILMDEPGFGRVIFAEEQSSGKGRLGRSFSSPPGDSLYASFILKPLLDVNDSLLITVGASVAVARAVEKIGAADDESFEPEIKWVNDVYLDNKKICGILTEAVSDLESGQIQSLILGIGINVNTDIKHYPKEIRDRIGIVEISPGQRNRFAAILINEVFHMQDEIMDYRMNGLDEPSFMDEYRQRSMVLGKGIYVIKNDEKYEAKAIDINNHGGLLVKYKTGETELLNTGEVSIRFDS